MQWSAIILVPFFTIYIPEDETFVSNLGWEIKKIFYAHNFPKILCGSWDSEVPFITAMGLPKVLVSWPKLGRV